MSVRLQSAKKAALGEQTEEDDFWQRDELAGSGDPPFLTSADAALQRRPDFAIPDTQKSEIPQHILRSFPPFP